MPDSTADRDLLRQATVDIAILARCLDVDALLGAWDRDADPIGGGMAADALDQARGLLNELAGGRADALVQAVKRIAATLPLLWSSAELPIGTISKRQRTSVSKVWILARASSN